MATSILSIELDEPDRVYRGGEKITGTVRVRAESDTKCKGLKVATSWRTHGSGNVTSGAIDQTTVFQGTWRAGEEAKYRFELNLGTWPPSYHGHHLNVDHYVDATASVPWAFDPKASEIVLVRPDVVTPEQAAAVSSTLAKAGCAMKVFLVLFGTVFVTIFGGVMLALGFLPLLFFSPFLLAGAGWWLFRKWLPAWRLGNPVLKCDGTAEDMKTIPLAPGTTLSGRLTVHPKRLIRFNEVRCELVGEEVCTSGSGSNRKTHRHKFLTIPQVIATSGEIPPGQDRVFDIALPLPGDAPYSIDLSDNKLNWSLSVRVDLPGWPDYVANKTIVVLPNGKAPLVETALGPSTQISDEPQGLSFAESARLLWDAQADPDRTSLLVEAISGLTLDATLFLDRRLLYAGDDEKTLRTGESIWWAHASDPDRPLQISVIVPDAVSQQWESDDPRNVTGKIQILGHDDRHDRLRVRWME